MKNCPNCSSELEDNFDLCWNCNYSFAENKVVEFEDTENKEKQKDIDSLYRLIEQTLCTYTRIVAETRRLNYSYRINRCRNYIINHVYEKLSVSEIAANFSLTPEYLSEQFKKETGVRLIDFIQKTRAQEAKKLLLCTEKPILEIASMLNYHDQSHFTKSFKSVYGVTPKACRIAGIYDASANFDVFRD